MQVKLYSTEIKTVIQWISPYICILGNELVYIAKETITNEDITEMTFEFEEMLSIFKNKLN